MTKLQIAQTIFFLPSILFLLFVSVTKTSQKYRIVKKTKKNGEVEYVLEENRGGFRFTWSEYSYHSDLILAEKQLLEQEKWDKRYKEIQESDKVIKKEVIKSK